MKKIVSIRSLDWIDEIKGLAEGIILSDFFHGSQSAENFSEKEIEEGILSAKKQGLLVSVLMNRMYVDEEIEKARGYMQWLCDLEVDWIYYQDPAVYMIACELKVQSKLVYDPDTLLTNFRDVQHMLNQGIHHSVISKEITLEEMKNILKNVKGPSEIIGFGYLKLSTSKRQLIQSYCDEIEIENTAKYRRDVYLIESTRKGKMPIIEDDHGTHIFSDYVLCAFDEIQQLKNAGLAFLRIEGIFMQKQVIVDVLKALCDCESGMPAQQCQEAFQKKYSDVPWSTGYMHQKTNLVK